ncbi:TetR family transcriptional regulator (plasmid) [Rhodococcus opacus]|uniref:TetR family transcriptional regulator n=1 Tax=Rhodococcus opacus TaxID=37919 RepID=A0A1B1KH32_RHOOP|nr:TetR/AcrR family transcriptional regulator [Rhodococcus opacus]ANS31880.1 TetR family transcriptional regulator [Rhodococcus opacus]
MSTSPDVETDNKSRILDAAADAFMIHGFANTTVDAIADDVGATKGLIYYHFRSKFDIFLAAYEHGMRQVREQVEPCAYADGTGRERLVSMSIAHVVNLMTDLGYHHVVHQGVREQASVALKPRQRDALMNLNELRRDYEQLFHRVISDGIDDGSLRQVDAALAARTLLSSLNAVDVWYRRLDSQSTSAIRTLAYDVVDLIVGGIAESNR